MNTKQMKVYLSIPISGRDIEIVKAELDDARSVMNDKGWESVSPLDGVTDYEKPWIEYITRDLEILSKCNAICRIWPKGEILSDGCDIEYITACHLGKIIVGYDVATGEFYNSIKAVRRERKRLWRNTCNEYLTTFCNKHEFDDDWDAWIGNDAGTIAQIADYFVGMNEIRYDVDNDVPEETFIKWYDYDLFTHEFELSRHINYESWCKGAPLPYSEEDIEKARQYQARISEAQRELEDFIRFMEVKQ